MILKKLGMSLVVVLALGAVMASSAFATASTEAKVWKVGTTEGGTSTLTGTKAVTIEKKSGSTNPTLTTKVGGTELVLQATGIECQSCTITNESATKSGVATGTGKIKFTGVTVVKPSTCAVTGGAVTSNTLFVEAHYMESGAELQQVQARVGYELRDGYPRRRNGCLRDRRALHRVR